jgi:hypothetical protein
MRVPVYKVHSFSPQESEFYERQLLNIPIVDWLNMEAKPIDIESPFIHSQIQHKIDPEEEICLEIILHPKEFQFIKSGRKCYGFIVYPSLEDLYNIFQNHLRPTSNVDWKDILKTAMKYSSRDLYGFNELSAFSFEIFRKLKTKVLEFKKFELKGRGEIYSFPYSPSVVFSLFYAPSYFLPDRKLPIFYHFMLCDLKKNNILIWTGEEFHFFPFSSFTSHEKELKEILAQFETHGTSYPYQFINFTPFYKSVAVLLLPPKPLPPTFSKSPPPPFDKKSFIIVNPQKHILKWTKDVKIIEDPQEVNSILKSTNEYGVYIPDFHSSYQLRDFDESKVWVAAEIEP